MHSSYSRVIEPFSFHYPQSRISFPLHVQLISAHPPPSTTDCLCQVSSVIVALRMRLESAQSRPITLLRVFHYHFSISAYLLSKGNISREKMVYLSISALRFYIGSLASFVCSLVLPVYTPRRLLKLWLSVCQCTQCDFHSLCSSFLQLIRATGVSVAEMMFVLEEVKCQHPTRGLPLRFPSWLKIVVLRPRETFDIQALRGCHGV